MANIWFILAGIGSQDEMMVGSRQTDNRCHSSRTLCQVDILFSLDINSNGLCLLDDNTFTGNLQQQQAQQK